jgi:hypothetical protein
MHDNMRDAASRGRISSQRRPWLWTGEKNSQARLTAAQVAEIRAEFDAGATRKAIAEKYGVCAAHVGKIIRGVKWRAA